MLHGVYFSASADDASAAEMTGREDARGGVMVRYWGQIARLFHSFEHDITRFRLWVKRDEQEKAEAEARVSQSSPAEEEEAAGEEDAEDAEEAEERQSLLEGLGGLSEQSEDAVWNTLENYIFYVAMPFLTDFFLADVPLLPPEGATMLDGSDCTPSPSDGDDEATYQRVLRSQSNSGEHRRASAQLQAWGGDALAKMCQELSRTLRKLVKLEYIMGKVCTPHAPPPRRAAAWHLHTHTRTRTPPPSPSSISPPSPSSLSPPSPHPLPTLSPPRSCCAMRSIHCSRRSRRSDSPRARAATSSATRAASGGSSRR